MGQHTIGVVGATGVVGQQLLVALGLRDVGPEAVRLFGSERSEGEELELAGESLPVERPDSFRGLSSVILAVPPEVARPLAARAQAEGVWVVDLSGVHRTDEGVPLLAPGVNDGVLDRPFTGRVVTMAWAPAQGFLAVLEPLRAALGLTFADVTVLLGAASMGRAGVERLSKQAAELMNGKEPDVEVFPHRLAFNIIPASGEVLPDQGHLCRAERTLLVESARVWRATEQGIAATCTTLTVPIYHGTTLVLSAHLKRAADSDAVRALLKATPGLKLLDEPEANVYPMPMLTNDDASVHVGRVRAHGERVQLVAALDNAFRAADTALDVALRLAARG